MKKYKYKCTLLSDVIITSDAATESPSEALDYIPGSKFLGIIAAQLYDESQPEKTLDLFHNGTVKYGDATLYYDNEKYLKAPFSWFTEKGRSIYDEVYIHHLVTSTGKQLKQVRSGYFSPKSGNMISLEKGFALKSAHDAENRRSKEGQMFGYQSLKAGTEWVFEVTDKKGDYAEEIKNILNGKHRVGRSRTAEYGLIKVEFLKESSINETRNFSKQLVIYASSNLCFIDEKSGEYTAQPTAEQLCGNKNAEILWDLSQVRSRNYKTWNRHRWNKDADRIIIERGSVFVIKINETISEKYFQEGIGVHKNEGMGQVLINPDFLHSNNELLNLKLSKQEIRSYQKSFVKKGEKDDLVLNTLQSIYERNDLDFEIDKMVNAFKREHKDVFEGISKNQWGTLRNYGKHLNKKSDFMKLIFDIKSGFVYTGQSESEWRKKSRRSILENHLKDISDKQFFPFILKLSSQMSKRD